MQHKQALHFIYLHSFQQAKYKCALENEDDISIVTPDWVPDCIEEGSRIDETEYHPRLLKLPKSLASQVPQPRPVREHKKRHTKKEESLKSEQPKVKESIKKKEPEKKSLFDTIQFSDEEEDSKKGISLLDQLKSSQTWKQPSTKPTMTTRMSAAAAAVTTPVTQDKPKTPLTAPISARVVTSPPPSLPPVTPQPTTATKDSTQKPSEGQASQNPNQAINPPSPQASTSGSAHSNPKSKVLTDMSQLSQPTSSVVGPKTSETSAAMPVTPQGSVQFVGQPPIASLPISTLPEVVPVMMPQGKKEI